MDTQIDSLDHITIITNNIESTMHFYIKIIGLSEDESRPPFKFNGAWNFGPKKQKCSSLF